MKNQGVWAMKVITLVLVVFVVGYMGYHIFAALSDPFRTVTCVLMRTEDLREVTGLFVRDEVLFPMPSGTLRFDVSDGERVSPGQKVATVYQDGEVLMVAAELRRMQDHLELLNQINNRTVTASDSARVKELVHESLLDMLDTLDGGAWVGVRQDGMDLRASLFQQEYTLGDRSEIEKRISETEGRISTLSSRVFSSSSVVNAPQGGLFVSSPDGFETLLRPETLASLNPEGVDAFLKQKPAAISGVQAGLILDSAFRYVFTLPEAEARKLGSSIPMRFHDEVSVFEQDMEVERISEPQDGRCAVILRTNRFLTRFYDRRRMDADVLFSVHQGLRVPRDAVRVDENGDHYVFCAVLSRVVKKPVEIIRDIERENFYLCAYNPASTSNLLEGDEIITYGTDLYDGMVIS
ncbi:MAG: hypothetical protein LBR85_07870 [Oscillospiraceae bacterium]|jgi:hypothetical protein|nr:hypothetical protein [Oscillospiraceae bacterium]